MTTYDYYNEQVGLIGLLKSTVLSKSVELDNELFLYTHAHTLYTVKTIKVESSH